MDEFGGFDNDLFGESEKPLSKAVQSYTAKHREPMWYSEQGDSTDMEEVNRLRHLANCYYSNAQYQSALLAYCKAAELSRIEHRDIKESLSRCYACLGEKQCALNYLGSLKDEAKSFDQVSAILHLSVFVYNKLKMFHDCVGALKQLCVLHQSEPSIWCTLAHSYGSIIHQDTNNVVAGSEFTQNDASVTSQLIKWSDAQSSEVNNIDDKISSCEKTSDVCQQNSEVKIAQDFCHKCNVTDLIQQCDSTLYGISKYEDNSGDEQTVCVNANIKSEDTVVDLKCYQLTCFYRAQQLLKAVEKNLRSFAVERNKTMQEKVDEEISGVGLSEELRERCLEYLQSARLHKESESDADDKYLLSLLPRADELFKEKWLSWINTSPSKGANLS